MTSLEKSKHHFVCNSCSARFKHRKHLQRHSGTHSDERPHKCISCAATFKRRDVLRKHIKSCAIRLALGEEVPEGSLPGKPARSCDHCAAFKKACDQKLPCTTCSSRNQTCTYNRAGLSGWTESGSVKDNEPEQATPDASSDFSFDYLEASMMGTIYGPSDSTIPEWWKWGQERPSLPKSKDSSYSGHRAHNNTSPSPWRIQRGSKFGFLLNCTRTAGLQGVFNYHRQKRGSSVSAHGSLEADDVRMLPHWDALLGGSLKRHTDEQLSGYFQSDSSITKDDHSHSSQSELEQMVQWLDDPLFVRTQELWNLFRPQLLSLSKKYAANEGSSESLAGQCLNFLSPPKIKKFVELFFHQWYPHCSILHKPTFDLATAPALLLAPVILMGACLSDDNDERTRARLYAEVVENLVFSHPLLSLYMSEDTVDTFDLSPVKIMQAAYLMCLLQNWEGDQIAQKRIRQYRFVTLIAMARDIGFSCANHNFKSSDAFNWTAFIEREETVRTLTYIFLLDSAFLIFNNAPPKLMVQELETGLTCPEEIFQAESAEACYDLWHFYQLGLVPSPWVSFSLFKAIDILASDEYSSSNAEIFSKMTTLNLFAIISGLHTVLFQHRTLFLSPPSSLQQIRLAIERWNSAWEERNDMAYRSPIEPWQELGFIRYADEYARLALARLDNLEARREQKRSASDHSDELAGFERLDETNMSQVTSLMLSLAVADS